MAQRTITQVGSLSNDVAKQINDNFTDLYAGGSGDTFTLPTIKDGLLATGSVANDFSGSTGTFLSSSGANTLSGAVSIADAATPSLTTATGKTNTGFVSVLGKTSGGLKLTAADATGQTITVTTAAQTSGAATITIPDLAGTSRSLPVAATGKTAVISNSITFAGTDSTTMTFPTTSATIARTDAANTFTGVQTMTSPSLTTPAIGVATGTSLAVTGLVTSSSASAGMGYATGAGGTGTQGTNRTTTVVMSPNPCLSGSITLISAAGSTTPASFTVTDSAVAATDTIIVNQKSGTDLYEIFVTAVGTGSFRITSFTTGGTTTETPVFNFAVLKAVAA